MDALFRKRTVQITVITSFALFLLGIVGALAAPAQITIGTSVSLSGEYAEPSLEQFNGLRLWLEQVNAAGGVRIGDEPYLVRIVSYDDGSDVSRIAGIYERLIHDDRVGFLFSPYSSSLGAAVAEVADRHEMIALLPGSASEEIFAHGYMSVYQLYPRGSSYFAAAVGQLAERNPSARLALLYKDDPFSRSTVAGARDLAGELGLNVVFDHAYGADTEDFSDLLTELASARPDALIGGGHVVDGLALTWQLAAHDVDLDFIALLAAPATEGFAQLGDAALGVVYPSPWEPGAGSEPNYGPTSQDFVTAYEHAYGASPQYFAASGYNAGLILQRALEAAGAIDAEAVHLALDQTDVVTFYGHIRFATDPAQHGLQIGHRGALVQWQAGADGVLAKEVVWANGEVLANLLYPKP